MIKMEFGSKICIFGNAGTGKSTLSWQLSQLLQLPVYHLDRYFWSPNWIERSDEEFFASVETIQAQNEWIMDGNYLRFLFQERLHACDTVIFLDFSRVFCLYRIIKRYYRNKNKPRKDLCTGCFDKLDWGFIKWVWGFKTRVRPDLLEELNALRSQGKRIFIFRKKSELIAFMKREFNVSLAKSHGRAD